MSSSSGSDHINEAGFTNFAKLYCVQHDEDRRELSETDFNDQLVEAWNSLSASGKTNYATLEAKSKAKPKKAKAQKNVADTTTGSSGSKKGKDGESRGRKRKSKEVDEDAPKRPMTAFFLFSKDHRPNVKTQHPDLPPTEVVKQLGAIWRGMNAADKSQYEIEAGHLRDEYEKQKAEYEQVKMAAAAAAGIV